MMELLMSIGTLVLYGGAVIGTNVISGSITSKSAAKKIEKKVNALENPTPEDIAKISKKEVRKAKFANIAITSVASIGLSAAATYAIEGFYNDPAPKTEESGEDNFMIVTF